MARITVFYILFPPAPPPLSPELSSIFHARGDAFAKLRPFSVLSISSPSRRKLRKKPWLPLEEVRVFRAQEIKQLTSGNSLVRVMKVFFMLLKLSIDCREYFCLIACLHVNSYIVCTRKRTARLLLLSKIYRSAILPLDRESLCLKGKTKVRGHHPFVGKL